MPLEDIGQSQTKSSKITLYKIKIAQYSTLIFKLSNFLDEIEVTRSQKYHFENDRKAFIIRRALLKVVLAKHTGSEIKRIKLDYHENKKPYLASHPSVYFNVSHTKKYALIVIGERPVGVDVEQLDELNDYSDTINNIFNQKDRAILKTAKSPKKAFFMFWTRKEAIVKATGKGIDDMFRYIPVRDGIHHLSSNILSPFTALSVLSFELDPSHLVSLAMEGTEYDINSLRFSALPSLTDSV